jgi:hypothetical protein
MKVCSTFLCRVGFFYSLSSQEIPRSLLALWWAGGVAKGSRPSDRKPMPFQASSRDDPLNQTLPILRWGRTGRCRRAQLSQSLMMAPAPLVSDSDPYRTNSLHACAHRVMPIACCAPSRCRSNWASGGVAQLSVCLGQYPGLPRTAVRRRDQQNLQKSDRGERADRCAA